MGIYNSALREDQIQDQVALIHLSAKLFIEDEGGATDQRQENAHVEIDGQFNAENILANAKEAADLLVEMAGFDGADSDHMGAEIESIVKPLMEIIFMRCPQLAERITGSDPDVQIAQMTND